MRVCTVRRRRCGNQDCATVPAVRRTPPLPADISPVFRVWPQTAARYTARIPRPRSVLLYCAPVLHYRDRRTRCSNLGSCDGAPKPVSYRGRAPPPLSRPTDRRAVATARLGNAENLVEKCDRHGLFAGKRLSFIDKRII